MGLLCGSAMTMIAMKMVGLESRLTWIMKVLGLQVRVGEGMIAVGFSGFVVEVVVVVVGLSIWCWWAMGSGSRFWVDGIVGRGWLQQRYGFWSSGYLSLFVDGLVGLGFWVGDWLR